jgi:hypothetical protein
MNWLDATVKQSAPRLQPRRVFTTIEVIEMSNVTVKSNETQSNNTQVSTMNNITISTVLTQINESLARGLTPAETKQYTGMAMQRAFNDASFTGLAQAFHASREIRSPGPMNAWWETRNQELDSAIEAINKALILHPAIASRHLNPVKFSVISLKGRDGMFSAVETEAQLTVHLRDNVDLRELLVRRGRESKAVAAAREVWLSMPKAYRLKVVEHHNRFVNDLDEAKVITVNGKKQKASLVRGIAHLESPTGDSFWATLGAQFAIRALFNLQHYWGKSAMFWAEAQRPIASWERYYYDEAARPNKEDPVYDGEELGAYEGPFGSRILCGLTIEEAHIDRLNAMDEMAVAFEDAETEAEEFTDAMVAALNEFDVEAPYLYKTPDEGRTFIAVTDKEEAMAHLIAKDEARAIRKVMGTVRATRSSEKFETRVELSAAIMDDLHPIERAVVEALVAQANTQ